MHDHWLECFAENKELLLIPREMSRPNSPIEQVRPMRGSTQDPQAAIINCGLICNMYDVPKPVGVEHWHSKACKVSSDIISF